ncbi:outer membrane protein [Helicobacter mehlei]|uniref:outer membrane protein n=1 Tax=Helicobacter mehlei TaxID=2316080 RepID=UPI001F37A28D|nr:outer membrane protein [Helicobacter mehlei]
MPFFNGYTSVAAGSSGKFNGNLFGADIQFGYKQFFGQKKHWGLRYYGFFSGQGGNYPYEYQVFDDTTMTFLTKKSSQPSANLFYGVGIDALYNFYEKNNQTYGFFVGVMIGGSSWLEGGGKANGQCRYANPNPNSNSTACISMNDYYADFASLIDKNKEISKLLQASVSPTFVQFIFNIGFRANLTKHQGFEVGIRIPTIDDPYFKMKTLQQMQQIYGNVAKGAQGTMVFRRNIAVFANYVYNF